MPRPIPNGSHKEDPFDGLKMETYKELTYKYGLTAPQLSKRLATFTGDLPARYGPSGRNITSLHVTPELDAWLSKGKAQ